MGFGLSKVRQFGVKIEGTEGTEESLVAADYAGVHSDLNDTFEVGEYERGQQRSSLTGLPTIKGDRMLSISGSIEFTGGTIAAAGHVDPILRSMGFARAAAKVVATGTITNPSGLTVGSLIGNNASIGSATKTAQVLAVLSGPTRVVYRVLTGSAFGSSEALFGYGSPAASMTTSGTPTDFGWVYTPLSTVDSSYPPSVTAEIRSSGQRRTLVGGRSTGRIMLQHNQPAKLSFEIKGPAVLDSNGAFRTGSVVASIPALSANPKAVNRATIGIDGGVPVITKIEIDVGNTVSPRKTLATNDLASSGIAGTAITDRNMTVNFDPETDTSGFLHDRRLSDGASFSLTSVTGDPTDTHGRLVIYAAAAQVRGSRSRSEKDGIESSEVQAALTGSADDEIVIAQLFGQ
jgi:hypothetical protein